MAGAWSRRWGPVGSKVILAMLVMTGASVAAFTFNAAGSGADTTPFNNGTATASATALDIAPSLAQLNIAVQLGTSQASIEYNEAQSLAETLNLGVIGDVVEADNCATGAPAAVQAKDFPSPEQAENTNGPQTLHAVAYVPGAGVGDEDASVTEVPSGTATTSIVNDDLAGIVDVQGATTSATTSIINGNERSATATSDMAKVSIANGLIVLDGLQWSATQTTGAVTSSTSSFNIAGITVAGKTIPVSNATLTKTITSVVQIINTALAAVGFEIEWPTATTASDGTVSISPLVVGIDNSALGQEVVGSQLGTLEPLRNKLQNELFALSCNYAGYVEIADILLGVPSGGGDLNFNLGGASAVTADQVAVSPFGSAGSTTSGIGITVGSSTSPSTAPSSFNPGSIGTSVLPSIPTTTPPTTTPSTTPPSQKVSLGPISKSVACHSLGPAGGGCDTSDVAVPVGLIAFGLLAVLAGWDYLRHRRRAALAAVTMRGGAA